MPTITQLPEAATVTASDLIPVSQDGSARSVSVGTVLSSVQPAITVASPSLIGRTSLGAGGPEQVNIGKGLELTNTTLAANGADHANFAVLPNLVVKSDLVVSNQGTPMFMPASLLRNLFTAGSNIIIGSDGTISSIATGGSASVSGLGSAIGGLGVVSSLSAQDLIAISQGGSDYGIRYANFLNGITIDQAQLAGPAQDTDAIWSAQGSNIMMRQNLAAIWTWIANKIPLYKAPVVELKNDTTLNTNDRNGRLLVCSQSMTLTPSMVTMGNGFICRVINVGSGNVTLEAHFVTSSGGYVIAPWQSAEIFCVTYSNGSLTFAAMGNAPVVSLPGQVIGLLGTALSPTTITLTWQLPTGVGSPCSYNIQYNLAGSSSWITVPVVLSIPTYQLSGLQAGGTYNVTVQASNAAGTGPLSNILTLSTTAATPAAMPTQVVGVTATSTSSSTMQLSWISQAGVSSATSYIVQYRVTGSSSWTGSTAGITGSGAVISGLQAGTSYDFTVAGMNSSGVGPVSSVVVATTASAARSVNSINWNLLPNGVYSRSNLSIPVNAHVSPATSPVQFGFSSSATVPPTSWLLANPVNTDLWGAYMPTPSSSGSWYVWGEGVDGSCVTVYATPFLVQ